MQTQLKRNQLTAFNGTESPCNGWMISRALEAVKMLSAPYGLAGGRTPFEPQHGTSPTLPITPTVPTFPMFAHKKLANLVRQHRSDRKITGRCCIMHVIGKPDVLSGFRK